ncbi:MAG: RnfABCDGE type electron transport complex subunit G [Bacteroidales bacterium]|nr:RnfABCDGE type electron transport complex subunit G [Bacteroidales bacterium]
MKKLTSTLPNMLLSLGIICIVAGALLASVNDLTAGEIAASKQKKLESALKQVIDGFDNNPSEETAYFPTLAGDSLKIYEAKRGEELIGVAVESNSANGFNGNIKVLVGLDTKGKLLNYSVLEQQETPGLGTKMDEWFRTDKKQQSVINKNLSDGALKVSKDGGDVDAITAATISSRAFLDAVNRAYQAFAAMKGIQVDETSGATESTDEWDDTTLKQD